MNQPLATAPAGGLPEERLDSWKEIAAYLNRGVSTVQRWERDESLPVHRQQHDTLSSVFAYKHEIDAWRLSRANDADRDEPLEAGDKAPRILPIWSRPYPRLILIGALAVAAAGALTGRLKSAASSRKPVRVVIIPPPSAPLELSSTDRSLAITPDGTRVVYVGGSRLFVRALDDFDVTPIAGMGSPRYPFLSWDGKWIGFFDQNTLKKVPITGGSPTTLVSDTAKTSAAKSETAETPSARLFGSRGAVWGPDHWIAFALEGRLLRVSDSGGKPEVLASPDAAKGEAAYSWPEVLPDGSGLLFTIVPRGDWGEKGSLTSLEDTKIALLDLRTRQQRVLLDGGTHAHYVGSGHLVYAASGGIKAIPFDLSSLTFVGTPRTVVPQVATTMRGASNFDVSQDGTLVYVSSGIENDLVTLTWVDRFGHEEALGAPEFIYRHPRLSPDGHRLAVGSPRDLGVWDFSTRQLLWFGVGPASQPVWTPDGRRILFASTSGGRAALTSQMIDGPRANTPLLRSHDNQFPNAISPDGTRLIFRDDSSNSHLMLLDMNGAHEVHPLLQTSFRDVNADISPDGQFFAYQSNETGVDEVYVQPMDRADTRRWLISSGGGRQPMWAPGGKEIFYVSSTNAMMSVPIARIASGLAAGTPTRLFDGPYYFGGTSNFGRTYDFSQRDGRFLVMKPVGSTEATSSVVQIAVVLNWFDDLRQILRN